MALQPVPDKSDFTENMPVCCPFSAAMSLARSIFSADHAFSSYTAEDFS